MKYPFRYIFLPVLLVILAGCVTQRKKTDLSTMGRFYHNKTAKFNAYYNADVLYTDAINSLNQIYPENYKQILPVYRYSAVDNADAISKSMDRAIEKVTKAAKIHPGSDWVADCYVLMGKAQFLKQDYESSQTTLEYFKDQFDPENPQNRARSGSAASRSRMSKKERSRQRKQAEKVRAQQQKERKKEREEQVKQREEEQKERDELRKEREKQIKERNKARSKSKKRGTKKRPTRIGSEVPDQSKDKKTSTTTKKEEPKPDKSEKEEDYKPNPEPEEEEDKKGKNFNQNKKDEGIFGHRDPYSEGRIWLAKTYIKRLKYSKAEYNLNLVLEDERSYKGDITEAHIVMGDLFIHKREYAKAIEHLEIGAKRTKDRELRARLHFIIGQLHSKLQSPRSASESYEQVIKNKPSYEMAFNANLNMLTTGMSGGNISSSDAQNTLDKLLKDTKNQEYKDQIHFAKAEIYLAQGKEELGYEQLLLALEASQGNRSQLGETHYLLAWMTFENENFVDAQKHFAGAESNFNQNDDRYIEVKEMAENLSEIAANLENIETQDSLLAISDMSEDEKLAFARKRLEDEFEANRNDPEDSSGGKNNGSFGVNSGSDFWAYKSAREIDKQARSFQRIWGDRILADDWRRGGSLALSESNATTENGTQSDELIVSASDIERILNDVPTSDQEKAQAVNSIMESMLALGKLYRINIDQPQKSVDILEEKLRHFPNSTLKLDSYFYLYLGYKDLGNSAQMAKYKDLILSEFPDSEYAQILGDPDYMNKEERERMALENYYNKTYDLFERGKYEEAQDRITKALTEFGTDHRYAARMDLLAAMIEGSRHENPENYIKALQAFAKKYPNTDETVRAKEIIRLLGGKDDVGTGIASEVNTGGFEIKDDKLHYVIVVLYNPNSYSTQNAKVNISNYNQEYHKLDKIKMTSISLNTTNETPLILLRRFENREKAMKYYDGIQRKREQFLPIEAEFEVFPINQVNYREVMRQKSVSDYREFFKEHYLEEK